MKRLCTWLAVAALLLSTAGAALAHDGWAQSTAPLVRVGEVAYVDLLFGNHSNEHGSYRIAGKWSMSNTKVYAVAPDGTKVDISANVFDTGEATEVGPAGTKGYYTAAFVPGVPGAYVVSVEGDSIFQHGEVASRTLRSAKAFVAAADIPVRERVAELSGFSRPVSPDRAEWVPLVNPAALTAGSQVKVQLLHKGQPLAGQHVTVVRRSVSEAQRLTTDANGLVTFTAAEADYYLVRAKVEMAGEQAEGQYNTTFYEATMTLAVQRGGQPLPVVGGQPMNIWVNGRQLALSAADGRPQVVNGRTFLPLRAVAEALGATVDFDAATNTVTMTRGTVTVVLPVGQSRATVNGQTVALDAPAYTDAAVGRTMVPLRFLAEAFGASVEYLPPVAGAGAAVLVNLGR